MDIVIAAEINAVIFSVERDFGTHQWDYSTVSHTKAQQYVFLSLSLVSIKMSCINPKRLNQI